MLLALALAHAAAPLQCDLLTGNGGSLRFGLAIDGPRAALSPVAGGGWPQAAMQGAAAEQESPKLIRIGLERAGAHAALELRTAGAGTFDPAEAVLRGPGGMPVAAGYCSSHAFGAGAAQPPAAAGDLLAGLETGATMDGTCHVLAEDGRRSTIRRTYSAEQGLAIEPLDETIWTTAPLAFRLIATPPSSDPNLVHQVAFIAQGESLAPYGDEAAYRTLDGTTGTLLLRFWRISAAGDAIEAMANCGVAKFSTAPAK